MNNNDSDNLQVNISLPQDLPVIYSDVQFVTSRSQAGVVLDFAQFIGETNDASVISRIGLSKEQAEELAKSILEALEKEEVALKRSYYEHVTKVI